jgi:hypothetical protein
VAVSTWHLGALTLSLLIGQTPSAGSDANPRAIVERAVKAQGGLEKNDQIKAVHRLARGSSGTDGFTAEIFTQDPGRIKIIHRSKDVDNPSIRTLVMEGDKGWVNWNGVIQELDDELQARFRRARHADRVSGLVALLRDKEKRYTLTALGPSQVKGKEAVGVKVAAAGQPDISLFFDKATGLLVKTAQRVSEPRIDNESLQEWYLSNYQVLDQAAPDEALLKKAGIAVTGPELLAFLQKRTPGPDMRERIQGLIKQLGAASFKVRSQATDELKKLGPEVGGLLRVALKDPDREVVRRATQVLAHYARQKEAPLVPAALRLLALRRPLGAVPVLLAYFPWAPEDHTADEVVEALAAVGGQPGKEDPALVNVLKDDDPRLRQAAAAALGRDGGTFLRRPGRRVIVEGLRYAARAELYRDGKRDLDLEVLDLQVLNRHDESVFARPAEQ